MEVAPKYTRGHTCIRNMAAAVAKGCEGHNIKADFDSILDGIVNKFNKVSEEKAKNMKPAA